jgi:diguanylate cyclase (GGDEF)-like protein
MIYKKLTLLLIDSEKEFAKTIRKILSNVKETTYELIYTNKLSHGLERLSHGGINLLLFDLFLPDSEGMETAIRIHDHSQDVPFIVFVSSENEDLGIKAVKNGAQDYLIKEHIDSDLLARSVRYSIDRYKMESELRNLSWLDELTGLYNRRGFLTFASQVLRIARRSNVGAILLFVDLDNMKWINDSLGHIVGDKVLTQTADILRNSFRASDIVSRLSGDEFAVLAMGAEPKNISKVLSRLRKNIENFNKKEKRLYNISLSIGASYYNPQKPVSVEELIDNADKSMYNTKSKKKKENNKENNKDIDITEEQI